MNKFLKTTGIIAFLAAAAFGAAVFLTPPPPEKPVPLPFPETQALSVVVMDGETGDIYGEKNGTTKINPASTTKMLTCILALEEGRHLLWQDAKITELAASQDGTLLGLRPGMRIWLSEVVAGMMLASGNDAAVVTAETVGGTYARFIDMMNEKAKGIGVKNSHFSNPSGLTDPNHYATAEDMARIAKYAMKNPEFRDIVKQTKHSMVYEDGTVIVVDNRNEFLSGGYHGANGIKTGMTEAAGDCLVASAEQNGKLMICAMYHDDNRWKDAETFLDYGFKSAAQKAAYEAELAAEPAFFKWVNQMRGRESRD